MPPGVPRMDGTCAARFFRRMACANCQVGTRRVCLGAARRGGGPSYSSPCAVSWPRPTCNMPGRRPTACGHRLVYRCDVPQTDLTASEWIVCEECPGEVPAAWPGNARPAAASAAAGAAAAASPPPPRCPSARSAGPWPVAPAQVILCVDCFSAGAEVHPMATPDGNIATPFHAVCCLDELACHHL